MLNEAGLKAAVEAALEAVFGKGVPVWEDDFPPIRAAITAYLASVQGEPVAVKKLEWAEPASPNEFCSYDHCSAASSLGVYQIEWKSWKDYDSPALYRGGDYLSSSISVEAAKVAAQADFEARIRSAIITHPADRDGVGREPITHRNEAAGYTETVNEDGPTITRKADEVLLSAEGPRRVVGCRVYDQKGVEAAWPIGTPVSIEHDGFIGRVIGYYRREDGKQGVVLQQDGTLVVHVYGEKWLKPATALKGGA